MRSTLRAGLLFGAASLAVPALADTGRIAGNLDGEPFVFDLRDNIEGLTGADFRTLNLASIGSTHLSVTLEALREGAAGIEGVVMVLDFDAAEDVSVGNLQDGEIMVIEAWPADSPDPTQVWIAEFDRFERVAFDEVRLAGDVGVISGQITSERFCLHEFDGDDLVAVRQDRAMVCRTGAVAFSAASAGGAAPAARGPVEREILGRIDGVIGLDRFNWVTILPRHGDATATLGELPGGTEILRLQGHSPSSPDFRRQQVVSITLVGDSATGRISRDATVPAEVEFFPGTDRGYYSSGGEGGAEARVIALHLDGDTGETSLEIEGALCRVEGFEEVAGACKSFKLEVHSEIRREAED